jgi:hypothetical protein
MPITQITTASDWFYEIDSDHVIPVAAWALHDDGEVVGLVSDGETTSKTGHRRLSRPKAGTGEYIHILQLTTAQKFSLAKL